MAFSVTIVKQFNRVIDSGFNEKVNTYAITMENDDAKKLSKKLEDLGLSDSIQDGADGKKYVVWPTDLMGKMRLQAQLTMGTTKFIGFSICYIVLVLFTLFFSVTYLKRVLNLAFLTMIAPFVALTYPIDKLNDGQAQGFNKWLREYIFNLLIQPMHLLLYTVLVSSVFDFAGQNTIYMLVVIGFMLPAEKVLRSLFGFEKSSTAGSLVGAAAGAGIVANGMQKLLRKTPPGLPGKDGKDKNQPGASDNGGKGPKFNNNFDATGALLGNENQSNQSNSDDNSRGNLDYLEGMLDYATESNNGQSSPNRNQGNNNNSNYISDDGYDGYGLPVGFGQTYDDNNDNQSELDDNGQAWQNYIDDPDNMDTTQQNAVRTGQGWQDFSYDPNDNNVQRPTRSMPTNNRTNTDNQPIRMARTNEQPNMNTQQENTDNDNRDNTQQNQNLTRRQKMIRGVRGVGRAALTGAREGSKELVGKAAHRYIQAAPKLPGKALKFAAKATVAGAAGTIGLAAGVASGDLKNVATYGIAGATAGAIAGENIGRQGEQFVQGIENSRTVEEMKKAYYGSEEEYKKRTEQKKIDQWKSNQKYRKDIESVVGAEDAKQMYESGEIDDYLKYNISDVKDMLTVHELQKENTIRDRNEAIAIHKEAQKTGDVSKMKKKDQDEWKITFSERFKKRGVPQNRANETADNTMKHIGKYFELQNRVNNKL